MSIPKMPQNAASPLLCGYRLAAQPPSLEQQAQNLVSAMEYWDGIAEQLQDYPEEVRDQLEEYSRLYRRARRAWVELRRAQGKSANAVFPTWVDDYYTES